MLSCKGKGVFSDASVSTNDMGFFSDVVWVVSSVTKTIRGVSFQRLKIHYSFSEVH